MTNKQKASLRALIKPMIKEEVTKVISKILPSLLAEGISDALPVLLAEMRGEDNSQMNLKSMMPVTGFNGGQTTETRKFSTDPILNEVLNKTQGGIPPESAPAHFMNTEMPPVMHNPMPDAYASEESFQEDYGQLETYTPSNANPMAVAHLEAKMGNIIPETNPQGGATTVTPQQLAESAPSVFKAITKDYRGLMKSIDAKKQASGPSNIDFSQLPPSDAVR
jgi:hypothetical protein